jgi:hypothetical protein
MAMLRVSASFCREIIIYWRRGNLRADGFGAGSVSWWVKVREESLPPGFRGGALLSAERGNEQVIREEKESIMIRLVFGGGWFCVGCEMRDIKWASVGVEK